MPASRIEYILSDAKPIAAITTAELRARLDGYDITVVDVADPAADAQPSSPLPGPRPDDIAYIIYTSGTTGAPKALRLPITTSPS